MDSKALQWHTNSHIAGSGSRACSTTHHGQWNEELVCESFLPIDADAILRTPI